MMLRLARIRSPSDGWESSYSRETPESRATPHQWYPKSLGASISPNYEPCSLPCFQLRIFPLERPRSVCQRLSHQAAGKPLFFHLSLESFVTPLRAVGSQLFSFSAQPPTSPFPLLIDLPTSPCLHLTPAQARNTWRISSQVQEMQRCFAPATP